jgi:hypothetical protein
MLHVTEVHKLKFMSFKFGICSSHIAEPTKHVAFCLLGRMWLQSLGYYSQFLRHPYRHVIVSPVISLGCSYLFYSRFTRWLSHRWWPWSYRVINPMFSKHRALAMLSGLAGLSAWQYYLRRTSCTDSSTNMWGGGGAPPPPRRTRRT